jgi:hypothetical protein
MEGDVEVPNVMEGGGNRGPSLDADDRGISLAANNRGASLDAMDGDTGLTDSTDASNGDVECKQPVRRSTRNKQEVDRMTFHTKVSHSLLKSLVKGFLLGLAIHSNYECFKPKDVPFQGSHPDLNPNPKQFDLGFLNAAEMAKLRELQALDMLCDLMEPNPDDHLWKCIAITKHKVRNLDEEDVHIKVKAIWGDGEETWVRLDAL